TRFSRDWSSDVCSSDLGQELDERFGTVRAARYTCRDPCILPRGWKVERANPSILRPAVMHSAVCVEDRKHGKAADCTPAKQFGEIGRASCRERVDTTET